MTSRGYFGKMNSTLGSVVPLAMSLFQAASSNWFHRMTLLSGGAHLLKPGAALDQVYNKEINTKKNFAMMFV